MNTKQRTLMDWNKANVFGNERIGNALRIIQSTDEELDIMLHALEAL